MKISGDWLENPATQSVMRMLEDAGHRALFVGGCVRNALMGRAVTDIDIATDAPPQSVMALANQAGLKAVPTGIDHGTVTVVADGIAHEVTTFRRDVETDGRHATVAFTRDITDDAARRDFTMNALYADRQGEVVDPLGGLPDLLAGRVRFVGNPAARIAEDYLRILRFFRFTAQYGNPDNGMDAEGLAACAANNAGIETLSRERLGAEMVKLLSARDPAPAVAAMAAAGVLGAVLAGADARALVPYLHFEAELQLPPDPIPRLAALGGQDVAESLRLSRQDGRRLESLGKAASFALPPHALGYRLGADGGAALAIRHAGLGMPLPPDAATDLALGANARFPVQAADLLPLEGKALGDKLRDLEEAWVNSRFSASKSGLLGRK